MSHRRLLAFLSLPLFLLAGCKTFGSVGSTLGLSSDTPQKAQDTNTSVAMRTGIAVSDEPLAARAGAAVLNDQGSAVDAVTTMFFALTATYPVAAGPGGGGICLVYDPGSRATTEFDFLTRAANRGGYYAIPGAVRGFYQMQRQFGALPWQRSVAPGEGLAATGFPISQALAVRLVAAQNIIRQDPLLAAVFLDSAGLPKPAGTIVGNRALAQNLSEIRLGGADGFYKGAAAAAITAYSSAQGGAITYPELAGYAAQQMRARTLNSGALTVALPGPRTGAGAFAGALMDALARLPAGGRNTQAASLAAVRQVLARFGITALPPDLGATGFAAVDTSGQAAACAVTMNGPFGTGRTATGTGVVLAASPAGQAGISGAFLTPMIAIDVNGVAVTGAGAGGPYGSAAITDALLKVAAGRPVERPRDLGAAAGVASYDTVNAITCQTVCVALPDPGGHGAGAASFAAQTQ
jgi:gamma-glutamyltranspeptidase / glutathione hydrolase